MSFRQQLHHDNVGNNNGEILNKFNWDLEITKAPSGIYWPGNQIFFNRLKTIGGLPDDNVSVEDVEVGGGFTIIQTGDGSRAPAEVTFEFQDYEDSSIGYLINQWKKACHNPYNKRSMRKALLVCDMVASQLNTDDVPVKQWKLFNGIINAGSTGDDSFTNKKELSGIVSMTIKFEWWDIVYLTA